MTRRASPSATGPRAAGAWRSKLIELGRADARAQRQQLADFLA